MYYIGLITAAILFSSQFLFNQKFEEECGTSIAASMLFSLYTSIVGFCVLFAINRFKLDFSMFSLFIAAAYSIVNILYTIASVKAFETVNLSAYSVFAMLGGMMLPSLYGIIISNEPINALKISCFIFIIGSLLFTIDFKQSLGKKIYYAGVFILNGLAGVLSVIHQTSTNAVDSFSFLMLSRIISIAICMTFFLAKRRRFSKITSKSIFYSAGFAVFCTVGNLLVLLSLKHLPASIQYPIITGGVMFISLIISMIRKEKVSYKNIISTVIAFAATILIVIPTA